MNHETRRKRSSAIMLLMNLVPAAGVFFLGWNAGYFLFLYWMENIVVGLFYAVKIAMCQGKMQFPQDKESGGQAMNKAATANPGCMKLFLVPFFMVHYGGFTAGHGVFLFLFFGEKLAGPYGGGAAAVLLSRDMLLMLIPLAFIQGEQFFTRFIGAGEYKIKSPNNMMAEPYGRILVLHVTIIFSAFVLLPFGGNRVTSLIIILFKTAVDALINNRAWKKLAASNAATAPGSSRE